MGKEGGGGRGKREGKGVGRGNLGISPTPLMEVEKGRKVLTTGEKIRKKEYQEGYLSFKFSKFAYIARIENEYC